MLMRVTLLISILLLLGISSAAKECKVVEFPDHIELVCDGDSESKVAKPSAGAENVEPVQGKHRPQKRYSEAAWESRINVIQEQRQKETGAMNAIR